MFQIFRIEEGRVTGQIRLVKSLYRLGRDRKNDIRFSSVRVSRFHSQLVWDRGGFKVRDLASANHTRVNGREVEELPLRNGDLVDLGGGGSLLFLAEEDNSSLGGPHELEGGGIQTHSSLRHALHTGAALEEMIGGLLDEVMSLMRAQRGLVALAQDGRLMLHKAVTRHLDLAREAQLAQSIIQTTLRTREVQIVDHNLPTHSMIDLSLSQVVCGPLILQGQIRGVIYLDTQLDHQSPSDRRLNLFRLLCDQAAIIIENHRMYSDLLATTQAQETLVKEKEQRLEIKDEMFRILSEHSAQGIFLIRANRLTYCNQAFVDIIGGRRLSAFLTWGEGEYEDELRRALGLTEIQMPLEPQRIEISKSEPQEQHLEIHTQPLPSHLRGVQGFVVDVTERHFLQNKLLGAQRMEALARLASGLAHDFNNLLTVIRGGVDILSLEFMGEQDKVFDEVRGACQRGAELTKQLLTLGKKRTIQTQTVDLNDALSETYTLLKHALPKHIACRLEVHTRPVLVEVDPTELSRTLLNMGVNAKDAITGSARAEGEGQITLHVETLGSNQELRKRFSWLSNGPLARITIADNGEGMSQATQERIFEPFFSTKGRRGGSGLGLSVVYKFIQECHGAIDVDSEEGIGTRFFIYLPLSERAPLTQELSAPSVPTIGRYVLLADEHETVRTILHDLLTRHGYEVRLASNAKEIEVAVRERLPDVILLDSALPGVDGFEVCRRLRDVWPEQRILLLSAASTTPPDPPYGGWPPILLKPIEAAQLIKTIERLGTPMLEEESTPTQIIKLPVLPS